MTVQLARAKINLALHVTGQRPDGYHLLDSFVVFSDGFGDRISMTAGAELGLDVHGPFSEGVPTNADNIVWRAAELVGWTGHISIEKRIPHGAGLGGGSSDAAAMLRALGASGDFLSLGADVPVCLEQKAVRMRGIGEHVDPIPLKQRFAAVLVNPGVHVSTPHVFKRLVCKTNPTLEDFPADAACSADWITWLRRQRNDLEAPALDIAPEIGQVLDVLRAQPGCGLARMSGSGATCFGMFDTERDASAAAQNIAMAWQGWWVQTCQLG